jgi:pimeloyl-ACP methyl ester carboxylesterase
MKKTFAAALLMLAALAFASSSAYAEDLYFDSDGVKIRYRVEGSGEPIVLIHGFGMNIEANWDARGVWQALSKDYRVIGLDVRGHGKSEKPHDPADYGPHVAKDIANLLDHLGIKKAHISRYSMGGSIALRFLLAYPERCRSALVGGQGWIDPGVKVDGPSTRDVIVAGLESGEGIKPLIKFLAPEGAPPLSEEELTARSDAFLQRNDAKAMAAILRGDSKPITRDALQKNRVPTLVVVGGNDPLAARGRLLAETMPHVKLLVIREATHGTVVAHPEYLEATRTFVDAHAGASE